VRLRQRVPATPRALEAICLKALARNPADRYSSALDLAGDVRRWLGEEGLRHRHGVTGRRRGSSSGAKLGAARGTAHGPG